MRIGVTGSRGQRTLYVFQRDAEKILKGIFSVRRPAVLPEDLILGLSGCHSSFLKLFHQIAQEESVPVYQLIVETSKTDRKAPSEELIRRTALVLKHTQMA